ncbi:MAG: HYR domain-containing protein, partial [Vicingaceae bacterium]
CGGTLVGTSATNSFTTGALTSTTIFYIRGEDGAGCVDESTGPCATVTVTVNALPTAPSAINPLTVCPSEDVILTATGSGTGDIVFYDNTEVEIQRNTMGGTATQTFNTGALTNGNYTFYVAEDNGTCQSLYDTLNVFVGDTVSPTLVCQPATVYLDNSGLAIVFPSDIDGGSSDNCGSVNLTTSIQTFTCNELGANNVTLFGDDGHGNVDSCSTVVTVLDTIIPLVSCQNISVFLDASGLAIISANDIDNGSADNCGGITLNSSIQTFTCNEIGTNQVMLYASDASNNIDSCMELVIVLDTINPTISCPTNITACSGEIINFTTPSGADNCSQTVTQTDATGLSSGMTFPTGITTIEFTTTDASGNTASCSFNVDVTGVDNSTNTSGFTITSNQTAATYNWIDCSTGNSLIPSETNASYTAAANGDYAVVVTVGSCTDTSACVNVTTVGINDIENASVSIYPNPTKELITVDFGNLQGAVNYTLTSIEGRIIEQQQNVTENSIRIDLSNESKGIYLLKIDNNSSASVYRIIRQ